MKFIIDRLVRYAEENMTVTKFELAKLRFMLEVIFYNTAEILVIFIFFAIIGKIPEFLVSAIVLVSVRVFTGGFHFRKYRYCFLLSFAVFALIILVLPNVTHIFGIMEGMLLATLIIIFAIAPVSKRNAAHPEERNFRMKIIAIVITLIYSVLLFFLRDHSFASIVVWALFLQAIQLIPGKLLMVYRGSNSI